MCVCGCVCESVCEGLHQLTLDVSVSEYAFVCMCVYVCFFCFRFVLLLFFVVVVIFVVVGGVCVCSRCIFSFVTKVLQGTLPLSSRAAINLRVGSSSRRESCQETLVLLFSFIPSLLA